MHEGAVLIVLDNFLEEVRNKILQGHSLPPETCNFIAPFIPYLTSGGNPDMMPVIKDGNMKTERRELTKLGFFREKSSRHYLGCNCPVHHLIQDMEETLQGRMSADEPAQRARELLTAFFKCNIPLEPLKIQLHQG